MTVERVFLQVPASGSAPALVLRPWRYADADALLRAYEDPELRRWIRTPAGTPEEAERWLAVQREGWRTGARFGFAVLEPGTKPVAHVAVKRPDPSYAEVGYWTSAAARGRGVASRAVEAVTRWAFDTFTPERLELIHDVGNAASCRVAERCSYPLDRVYPPHPPRYPDEAHVHVRRAGATP